MNIVAAVMVASVALVGCTSEPEPATCDVVAGEPATFLDLRVYFTQPALAGMRTQIVTYDLNDPERVFAVADTRVDADGLLEQTWTDAYQRPDYQPIVYYVDVDDNGRCTPGVDLGERFITSGFNPVGDPPLDHDLAVSPLPVVTAETCRDVERCAR